MRKEIAQQMVHEPQHKGIVYNKYNFKMPFIIAY